MPWKEVSIVSARVEFVQLALSGALSVRELCRRYQIAPKTGYKWIARFRSGGVAGLQDQSRRPHLSPASTAQGVEAAVLGVRDAHPAWGGRKLRAFLQRQGQAEVPAASTITVILERNGRLRSEENDKHRTWQRFEHEAPNRLWQMDFKGHFALREARCHPLTILDDHSRYALALEACSNERSRTVQTHLITTFRRYGLPERMLMDNGSPWGNTPEHPYTPLTAWLIRLGIGVSHGRPYHPQTQGKDERFHRTFKAEVLNQPLEDMTVCARRFEEWRHIYNHQRPHQALEMQVPASRYKPSARQYPEMLPEIEYGPDDVVRRVIGEGKLSFRGRLFRVSKAFRGYPVALRPGVADGEYKVFFCHEHIATISFRELEENS